ncbi:MAG: hypothetical protein J6V25_11740 [Oscillospiraceae bacterium]|nr:hypothetical protein [Oscillospiraceae bacterium]
MAVDFLTSLSGEWTYARGTLRAHFSTSEGQGSGGNVAVCPIAVAFANGIYTLVQLFASTEAHFSDIVHNASIQFSGDLSATTTNGSSIGPGTSLFPPIAQWIDEDTKDDVSPRIITQRVNEVPWFNYTNATLYDKLRELYPAYKSFSIASVAGGAASFVPNPYSAGLNSNYNFYEGTISEVGVCGNAPGLSSELPASLAINGKVYDGNPSELEGQNWQDINALAAYLLLTPNPPEYLCHVDMYFNGNKEPNISVEWKGYEGQQLDPTNEVLTASKLHIVNYAPADIQTTYEAYYTYIDSDTGIRRMNDLVFNRVNKLRYIKPVAPGDKINSSYLSQVDGIIGTMNQAQRILEYGINGLPEHLVWYLQVEDPDHKLSSLWQLAEPRESETGLVGYVLTEFTDATDPTSIVALEVVLHEGPNPDDITDDDTTPPPPPPQPDPTDWDDDEGHGFPGDAVLTKTYSMTAAVLQNIGQKLWTQSYFDVLKIQNNPIQNIVSVKWFPFNLTDGTTESVKVGNVDFGINATRISTVKRITIGSVTYNGVYGNFLDGSPYTTLKLNLPYVGQIQLDASEFLGCSIGVEYIVDLITGECVARVKRDGVPLYDYPGHMGVDIVLTSSDRVQADMKAVSSGIHTAANTAGELIQGDVIGAVAGAATGALSVAGMDYNSQRVGSPSGVCGSFQNHKVWLTVSYPKYYQSEGFTHVFGRPVNKYLTLDKFNSGDYVQVDRRTDLKVAMTSDENAELEKLMVGGVYI